MADKPQDAVEAVEFVSFKIGVVLVVLVVLGAMHFFNVFNFAKTRHKGKERRMRDELFANRMAAQLDKG